MRPSCIQSGESSETHLHTVMEEPVTTPTTETITSEERGAQFQSDVSIKCPTNNINHQTSHLNASIFYN